MILWRKIIKWRNSCPYMFFRQSYHSWRYHQFSWWYRQPPAIFFSILFWLLLFRRFYYLIVLSLEGIMRRFGGWWISISNKWKKSKGCDKYFKEKGFDKSFTKHIEACSIHSLSNSFLKLVQRFWINETKNTIWIYNSTQTIQYLRKNLTFAI